MTARQAAISGSRRIFQAFVDWAGRRAWYAAGLMLASATLEGAGLMLLVPLISIAIADRETALTPWLEAFFSTVGAETENQRLLLVISTFLLLIILRQTINFRRDILNAQLETGFVAATRKTFFDRIAAQSWTVASGLQQGRMNHAMSRDLDRAANAAQGMLMAVSLAIVSAVQLVLAIILAPLITLGALVAGALMFAVLMPLRRRATRLGRALTDSDFRLFSSMHEFLRGLKPAKAHGLEHDYLTRLADNNADFVEKAVAIRRDVALASAAMQTMAAFIAVGAVLIGHMIIGTDPASLIVVLIILVRLSGPVNSLQSLSQQIAHAATAYEAALDLIKTWQNDASAARKRVVDPWPKPPHIVMRDVCWPDPKAAPPILAGVSAEIPAGCVTAIAGPSGVGKTTLCDLCTGLHVPSSGRIIIDGQPLDQAARHGLQAALSYVGQESPVLQSTLRAMLTWGVTPAPDDRALWAMLDIVDAADLVRASLDGLETELHGDVTRFSGGERQRFRMARALLRKPVFLVLDEATNALDTVSEHRLLKAVFTARQGATVLMVSHREETVALADHVIRLDPATPRAEGPNPGASLGVSMS